MTFLPGAAGRTLKAERENRGIALEDVAASTKIPLTMLEALERDDLSRWPHGLYRRAFFRAYVTAIGLPPEPLTSDFVRSFPGELPLEPQKPSTPANASGTIGTAPASVAPAAAAPPGSWRSVLIALAELTAVAAAGALVAWAGSMTVLAGAGLVALGYYPIARAIGGRTSRTARAEPPRSAPTMPRRLLSSMHSSPARVGSGLAFARTRVGRLNTRLSASCRPVAQRIARAVRMAGTATHRAVGQAARYTAQHVSRGLAATNYAFWTMVRAAAAHAQVFASRQLGRTRE